MTIVKDTIFNVKKIPRKGYIFSRSPPLLYINCCSTLPSLCKALHNDGWGEGFEQHEIEVGDGEIYVHFWSYENYYIHTEEEQNEYEKEQNEENVQGMQGINMS